MAEDTFRNMVGDAAGKLEVSNKMVKCMARFLNRQNGSNLEGLSGGKTFKHYVYSAYGFLVPENANFDPQSR
jgi:hypothetical protein